MSIHRYARVGDLKSLTRELEEGVDADGRDEFGATALHLAIAHKHRDLALFLLSRGSKPSVQNAQGSTALHSAIEHLQFDVARRIVEAEPECLTVADRHGNCALWTAAFNARGDYSFVRFLVENGADPRHKNAVGLSPLDIAERFNDPNLHEALLRGNSGHA